MKRYENNDCFFFVGDNARENWQLLDQCEPHDLLFHLKDSSSAYVVAVRKRLCDHNQEDIRYAASLFNNNNKSVLYTQVRNVVKGKRTGEVIVNEYKTIRI